MAIFQPGRQMFKGEHKSARGDEARRIAANTAKLYFLACSKSLPVLGLMR
jgi:hypothetical protein